MQLLCRLIVFISCCVLSAAVEYTMEVIPGSWTKLPINLTDESNNQSNAFYHLSIVNSSYNSTISVSNEYISSKLIQLYGNPGDTAVIKVETVHTCIYPWEVAFTIQIHMSECPPGYIHTLSNGMVKEQEKGYCQCAATSNSKLYDAIAYCNDSEYQANMKTGYWLGYMQDSGKEKNLLSGICLIGCVRKRLSLLKLPNNTDRRELDSLLCGNRTGILCGICRDNLSSYYHSPPINVRCGLSDKCSIGWLIYLVSEILPITIFFLVTLLFDINFTNGWLNGLIFYFQFSETLTYIKFNDFVNCPSFVASLLGVYGLIAGTFSLNFLNHNKLSFCLWYKAETINLLTFRYLKIIYSLFLVMVTIGLLKIFNLKKITDKFSRYHRRRFNVKTTTIHGLSGFLIIFYSECMKVSLLLLTPIKLHTNTDAYFVAIVNGNLRYFGREHLFFAIPALFFLIFVGVIPPLLLIIYPLCYRLFGMLKIAESKCVRLLCMVVPLEKLKPLYDSLQSSFKDEYRFFSGLYFLYRLIAILTFVIIRDLTNYYTALIIEFALIFCLHAIIKPYKKQWQNALDSLIFTNIIILTVLDLYNYRRALELKNNEYSIQVACSLQIIFLYTPLISFAVALIVKALQKLKGIESKRISTVQTDDIRQQDLSESLLCDRRENPHSFSQDMQVTGSSSYQNAYSVAEEIPEFFQ